MELIKTNWNTWYWFFDNYQLPFGESIEYKTKNEALLAALNNDIKWEYKKA